MSEITNNDELPKSYIESPMSGTIKVLMSITLFIIPIISIIHFQKK